MSSEASARLRTALDLHDAGVEMYRAKIRREQPDAGEEQIADAVRRWLHFRPGAAHGDTVGRAVPEHRLLALPDLRKTAQIAALAQPVGPAYGMDWIKIYDFDDVAFVALGESTHRLTIWQPFVDLIMNAIPFGPQQDRALPGGFLVEHHVGSASLLAAYEILDPAAFQAELEFVDETKLLEAPFANFLPEVYAALRQFVFETLCRGERLFYVD